MRKRKKSDFVINFTKTLALLIVLSFASCSDRPSNVLSENKMVHLMADMEIAEAYSQQMAISNDERMVLGRSVMASYGVTEEQLDTTLAWYGRNIDKYTELFDKVDKEINKKKEKYSEQPLENVANYVNLWPYSKHLMLMAQSDAEALVFSFPDPGMESGEMVKMTFALPVAIPGKGVLGVEYEDGSGEIMTSTFNTQRHVEMSLQSDTLKPVSRLYGSVMFKERENYPVYIDSISLILQPLDSVAYSQKQRTQKPYGALRH